MEILQSPVHLSPLARHGPISMNIVGWLEPGSQRLNETPCPRHRRAVGEVGERAAEVAC
jgi:hypothetical protein